MRSEEFSVSCFKDSSLAPEDRHDVFDGNHEETIITFEIHGYSLLRIKEHPIVLLDGVVLIARNLSTDRDDPTCDGRNLDLVGQVNPNLSDLLILILTDENPVSNGLDGLDT